MQSETEEQLVERDIERQLGLSCAEKNILRVGLI